MAPPLSDVIFWRRLWVISTYLGVQSQYTFFERPANFLDSFFKNCPPSPFEKS